MCQGLIGLKLLRQNLQKRLFGRGLYLTMDRAEFISSSCVVMRNFALLNGGCIVQCTACQVVFSTLY